jgi:hypothetical protein
MTKNEVYEWYQTESHNAKTEVIDSGNSKSCTDSVFNYQIVHGKSIDYVLQCQQSWGKFILQTLTEIKQECLTDTDFIAKVNDLPFHDSHWNWMTKYCCLNATEYNWFYLLIEGKIEAICIISHPKESVFDKENIFYIEYIAVAPWNRRSKFISRTYSGLGTVLIKSICHYFIGTVGYRPGFSLSAVPQAIYFYEHLGMTPFPQYNHDSLFFYEMNEETTKSFLGGTK